ncbi:MAG: NADPH-dependent oxidoreductase [Bacteroidales bacterium]|nr:NADPH-dependent oxidoreductase [Bacteroidales bacterium]
MDTIFNHRSIRKYQNKPIDNVLLQKILSAGTRASTTGNMQVYSIVVTKDAELKNRLWEAHFKQDMVKQAPIVLTFCADFNRFTKWCEMRDANAGYDNFLSFFTAAIDALLVAQNVVLEAEHNGLGICYLGTTTYMAEKIVDILQLPKLVVPVTTLVLGYPAEQPSLTDRLPVDAVVHQETYGENTDEKIEAWFSPKEAMEFYRNFVKENGKQTLAQVFAEVRYTGKDNRFFSQEFLKVIKNQGFMNN